MPRKYRIGIVGFGIAGGTAAVLLARQGHDVTIMERARQLGPVGAGILLQPSGQTVLHRLGLLKQVLEVSEPLTGLHAVHPNGKTLIQLRYDDAMPGHCGYGVHRGVLFEALREAANAAGVTVCLDSEIFDHRDRGGLLAITTSHLDLGPFDFLVACDGSRSQMRQLQIRDDPTDQYPYGAIWMLGKNTQVRGHLHQVVSGTQHLLGLLPVGGDRCTLFWGLRHDSITSLRERGFEAWREEVIKLCPLAGETLADTSGFDELTFTGYRRAAPARPVEASVVLLGDAAHPMSPHLGQGANLALLDAACFADALECSEEYEQAFSRYYASRRSAIRYYSALSRFLTPFFQSNFGALAAGRNIALPVMAGIPPLRREMARAMAGIKQGLFGPNLDYDVLPRIYTNTTLQADKDALL